MIIFLQPTRRSADGAGEVHEPEPTPDLPASHPAQAQAGDAVVQEPVDEPAAQTGKGSGSVRQRGRAGKFENRVCPLVEGERRRQNHRRRRNRLKKIEEFFGDFEWLLIPPIVTATSWNGHAPPPPKKKLVDRWTSLAYELSDFKGVTINVLTSFI